jgi:hypothetical protein
MTTKPVVNERLKLRIILNNLVQDCQNMDMNIETINLTIKLAHDQIIELFRECLPKKKDGIVALLDKQGKRYYKTEQLPQAMWNECITEVEKKIGGER